MSWPSLAGRLDAADGAQGSLWLRRARLATATLDAGARAPWPDAPEVLADLWMRGGRIAAIRPAGEQAGDDDGDGVDLRGRWLLPPFADAHVHLDKTFTAARVDHAQPGLLAAVRATMGDRARWTPDDVERRAEHAVRLALAHGTAALRTHVDVRPGAEGWMGWDALRRLRERWRAHIRIELVAMPTTEACLREDFGALADRVARDGGLLGGVTKAIGKPPAEERAVVEAALDALMRAARERGLAIDLHVDESCDPTAASLDWVARKAIEHGMAGQVTCGHCCSLSVRDGAALAAALVHARAAGLSFVTLPLVNAYLQDRAAGRTPRLRGIAPVLEMKAAGLPVAVASDNCGDAFHPFGQHDLLEVLRAAARLAHLDAPLADWLAAVTVAPAALPGCGEDARLAVGGRADLNLFDAADVHALLGCPPARRLFLRGGRRVQYDWPDAMDLLDRRRTDCP